MPITQDTKDDMENTKILDGDGTAPKAVPEDTSAIGEDGIPLSPKDHAGVQFIPPSRGSGNGDAKVEIGGVGAVPQFVGLGKEELMRYANDPFWVRLRWFLFILFWVIWVGMLAAAIVIIILAPKCTSTDKVSQHLANNGPFYQFALNSISDGDKFNGLAEHIDYIAALGMKSVIISQFQNPKNLKEVDPGFGNIDSLKTLVDSFKDKDIRVLLQLSPNQVSKEHAWFLGNDDKHKDFFVTGDAAETDKSTWQSWYGGKAWAPYPGGTKNYLHQFRENEPDLNYVDNEEVAKEMNGVLRHWFNISNGTFGFLLSDVSYLIEDLKHLENQNSTINQPGNKAVLEKLLDASTWDLGSRSPPFALLDVDHLDAKEAMQKYTGDSMIPILTDLATQLNENFTAEELKAHMEAVKPHFVIRRLSGPRMKRIGNLYGTTETAHKRADIMATVAYLLPGELIVYYGDEVGVANVEGPLPGGTLDVSVEPMNWNPNSDGTKLMSFYKCLSKVHNSINQTDAVKNAGSVDDYIIHNGTFSFKRDDKYVVVLNLNDVDVELNLSEKFSVASNGTLLCATPNLAVALDKIVDATTFNAVTLSGYVIEFGPKDKN